MRFAIFGEGVMDAMRIQRWVAVTAAGVGALAIGVVAVAAAPSPSPSASGKSYGQVFIDKLAGILHLNSQQTMSDLEQAEIATVNQMVADGRITRAQGDAIINRIKSGQGIGLPFGGREFKGGFGPFGGDRTLAMNLRTAELNAVAGALKLSASSLESQLQSGKSLSQIESAQGVSDGTVRSAAYNAAKGVLDKAVSAGTITTQQEQMLLNGIQNGRGLFFGGRGWHHFGPPPAGTNPPATNSATGAPAI
jgi:hypothetical protein